VSGEPRAPDETQATQATPPDASQITDLTPDRDEDTGVEPMKKLFAVVLLASAAIAGCGAKKESTTPSNKDKATLEKKDDATGGQSYGGHAAAPAGKDTPNPCAAR
jgi:hypothetical protein